MCAIQALQPNSAEFLNAEVLKALSICYNIDNESLTLECTLAKRTLINCEMENISDLLIELTPLKVAFPNLTKIIQISLTICVSTASCERSFCTLKRIKTYLRSTMFEQRLNDLSILFIEKEISGLHHLLLARKVMHVM